MSGLLHRPAWLLGPALVVVATLLGLPLCMVVVASFGEFGGTGGGSFHWSLANYESIFGDDFYPGILLRTVTISLAATALSVAIGFVLAMKLRSTTPRMRTVLIMIIVAPLLVSAVARTYGWLLVLGEKGLVNALLLHVRLIDQPLKLLYNDWAVIFGLTHLLVAFPALAIQASLERIDPEIMEAAEMAGASPWRKFTQILLPMTTPGIAAGAIFSFTLAMSAYVTPALMGGEKSVLATLIYQKFVVSYDWNFGACLALLLVLASLVGTVLIAFAITGPYRRRITALRMAS
ncbi:ABC transporter permease [Variovorax paradoxus]|uniref:ABC transporter permease n=1 Tax=Variovorax paradoxus TaxID=34073 RepID=UPI003D66002D